MTLHNDGRQKKTKKNSNNIKNKSKKSIDSSGGKKSVAEKQQMTTMPVPPPLRDMRPMAAFCLPVIGFQNDDNGYALKSMCLTNPWDFTKMFAKSRPTSERNEICSAMRYYRDDMKLDAEKLLTIEQFTRELEEWLTVALPNLEGRRVHLEIYGSMRNGFGTNDCDVDMSLSFYPDTPEWAHYCSDTVMREVAKVLVDYPHTLDERFIAAKVPIVRFRGVHMDIEADISYDNRLALYNTKLLNHYCCWDSSRLPTVGVWIKAWAKRCGIGDASKGGLSSYAWIIMLIHYMQNCGNPPLLRRLQSEYYSRASEENVLGWDVYFWKFINPHENTHRTISVYEVFIGFLEYYITFFRFRRHEMVQIRRGDPACYVRPERWRSHSLCIQDPFELDHNLAHGVDGEMLEYIIQCLTKSRSVFMDSCYRERFLQQREIVAVSQMDDHLLKDYADFLLHSCTLDKQPPIRHFFRDRTASSCTTSPPRSEYKSPSPPQSISPH